MIKRVIFLVIALVTILAVPAYAAEGDIPPADSDISLIETDATENSGEDNDLPDIPVPLPTIEESRPFLQTPFDDYSVIEGYLLLIFLSLFAALIISICKGALSWL